MDVFDLYAKISLDTSGYDAGLQNASNTTKSFGSKLGSGLKSAAKLATTAFAAISGAAVAATGAFISGAKEVAEYGDNIDKMSQKMGMSAEAYQEWDAVMRHSGTSMETMKAGMKTLANAVENGNEAFKRIGLTQEELAKMSQEDIFAATIEGLQNVEDVTERTYLAGQLLGRGATELGALLNTSAEETQAMRDRVHELGGVMSDEAVKASARFQDNLQDMTTAISGVKRSITSDLLPGLNLIIEGFTSLLVGEEGGVEAFEEGFKSIIDTVGEGTERVFGFIGKIGPTIYNTLLETLPKALSFGADLVGNIVKGITEHTGDIVNAVTGALDVITNNVGSWIDLGGNLIISLATGITRALPQLVSSIAQAAKTLLEKITDPKLISSFLKSGLEMIKSMATGLIRGIPALISEIPVIIRNVLDTLKEGTPLVIDTLVELVEMIASELPTIIEALADAIPDILDMIVDTLITLLPVIIDGIIRVVLAITDHLPEIIQALIDAIPQIIQAFISAWMAAIPAVVQGIIQLVSGIIPHIPEIIWGLIQAIPSIIAAILEGFSPLTNELVGFFKFVWDSVKVKIEEMINGIKEFFEPLYEFFEPILTGISELFGTVWELIYTTVTDFIDSIKKSVEDKFNAIKTFLGPILDTTKNMVVDAWQWISENVVSPLNEFGLLIWEKFEEIKDWAKELVDGALNWGKDMINNFIAGLKSGVNKIGETMSEIAGGVSNYIHFSEPDVGPLSDFHTYAPDMIDLFTKGIKENKKYLQDTVADAFDFQDLIEMPEVSTVNNSQQIQRDSNVESLLSQMLVVMRDLAENGFDFSVEPNEDAIFDLVNRKNRQYTRATGYNSLQKAGGKAYV